MTWSVAVLTVAAVVIATPLAALAILFVPLRRFPLHVLRSSAWPGRVPYRIATVGGHELLVVRGLPYPGSFSDGSPTRQHVSLDGAWRCAVDPDGIGEATGWWQRDHDDSSWFEQQVPATFNPAESDRTDHLGLLWYRRRVRINAPPERGLQRLRFDGLLLRGKVWWNDRLLGEYEGGYTANYFDVSGFVQEENTVVVLCDNRLTEDSLPPRIMPEHNAGWHTYAGIHRSARLEFLPQTHVVSLRTTSDAGALRCVALVRANVVDGLSVRIAVADDPRGGGFREDRAGATLSGDEAAGAEARRGAGVATVEGGAVLAWEATLPLDGLAPWSPDSARRYRLTVEVARDGEVVDRVAQTGGVRTVTVEGEAILLNDRSVFLRGIGRHEDHPTLGATQRPESIEADLRLIDGMSANYVRLVHYPHAEEDLEACERRGLLVSEEIPLYQAGVGFTAWWSEHQPLRSFPARLFGIRQTRRPELLAHARRQLLEMIERDRHRPAVIFWGLGNECYSHGRRAAAVFSELARIARRADPTRPVTYVEMTYNIPFFDDRRRGWIEADILSLNSYFGWYFARPEDLAPHLERLARRWRGRPLILSEFGAGAAPGRMASDGPWPGDRIQVARTYGEDYQAQLLDVYWQTARSMPWVRGVSPWVFADFYNVWFPANPVPNYNLKGVVSAGRTPKLAYRTLARHYEGAAGARLDGVPARGDGAVDA